MFRMRKRVLAAAKHVSIMQDLSVQFKVLLAGVTILLLLRQSRVVDCRSKTFQNAGYVDGSGEVQCSSYEVSGQFLHGLCGAYLDINSMRDAFVALVVINQTLFIFAIVLKHRRPWRGLALTIAIVVGSLLFIFAMLKIAIVTSTITRRVRFECITDTEQDSVGYCIDGSVSLNITQSLMPACRDGLQCPNEGKSSCTDLINSCADQCQVRVPFEVYLLCATFVLSALYSFHLVFEYYLGRDLFTSSEVAKGVSIEAPLLVDSLTPVAGKIEDKTAKAIDDAKLVLRARRRRMWYLMLQDGVTLIKYIIVVVSLVVVMVSELPQCDELYNEAGVRFSGRQVRSACEVKWASSMPVYVFAAAGALNVVLFILLAVVEKRVFFAKQSFLVFWGGLILLGVVFLAKALALIQTFDQDVHYSCSSGDFTDSSKPPLNSWSATCTRRTIPAGEFHTAETIQCADYCRAAFPGSTLALMCSALLTLVYEVGLLLRYMVKATERMNEARRKDDDDAPEDSDDDDTFEGTQA